MGNTYAKILCQETRTESGDTNTGQAPGQHSCATKHVIKKLKEYEKKDLFVGRYDGFESFNEGHKQIS